MMNESPPLLYSMRWWLPSTKARRVQAAKAVLVSICTFAKLYGPQRVRVDDELIEIYRPLGIYPWWRFRKDVPPDTRAADRAIAMRRLNIPTVVPGLTWDEVLHPWHKLDPTLLVQDFHPYHLDTDEALDYLTKLGLSLPEGVHYGRRWFQNALYGGTK